MIQANVHEAKTRLSQLIARAEAGEEVVIARGGTPVVRLAPVAAAPRQTREIVGCMADEIAVSADAQQRALAVALAAELLETDKFDRELSDVVEFIPATR